MRIILSHPTGNANVRALAGGLAEAGLLERFYTTIACFPGSMLHQLGGLPPFAELRRRSYDQNLRDLTYTVPFYEAGRMLFSRLGWQKMVKHEHGRFSVDAVYQNLDLYISKRLKHLGPDAVYGYEDGAYASFREAKSLGIKCLYDLPIGYWRSMHRLLSEERERRPQWAGTLTGFHDSPTKLQRKDEALAMADTILVASSFTARTLEEYPRNLNKIKVIPYGYPPAYLDRKYSSTNNRKLKILFVGGLSQRKGVANLFEALHSLEKKVELTVVGNKAADCGELNRGLDLHRWIPSLAHADVLNLMREQDLLVFPSLFEGFGLVVTEAMSQGTPVITTERTCGPDLIRDGENGWLTKAGDSAALHERIVEIIEHPEVLETVGREALKTAASRPWSVYGKEVSEYLSGFGNERN